jgi:hypothetical protein
MTRWPALSQGLPVFVTVLGGVLTGITVMFEA